MLAFTRTSDQSGRPTGAPGSLTPGLNALPVYASFGFLPVGQRTQRHGIASQPMRLEMTAGGLA